MFDIVVSVVCAIINVLSFMVLTQVKADGHRSLKNIPWSLQALLRPPDEYEHCDCPKCSPAMTIVLVLSFARAQ